MCTIFRSFALDRDTVFENRDECMTKSKLLASLAILITLTACASERRERLLFSDKTALDQTATIQVGSLNRTFKWHVPKTWVPEQRLPVIVLLHGGGGSGANIGNITQPGGGFNTFADQNGFIAIYPDALGGNWNDGRETIPHKNDDVAFVIAAIDYVAKTQLVDLSRVYVAGISNGGMMAQRIACDAPHRISAVAVIAAALPRALANACRTSGGIPVVFLTGDADPKDGTITTLDTYQSKGSTTVAFYKIAGGGHTWPGGTQYVPRMLVGNVAMDFSANQAIWDFFSGR
jgi:polyhydroxybutyrate depolymerase